MKKTFILSIMIICFFGKPIYAQNNTDILSNAISKLKNLITDHIIEKTYLHFDHPYAYYVAGDNIYFKAYVTMGELHEPSTISSILHVDLIGQKGAILQSISLLLNNGVSWGDFSLPASIPKGTYRIRAYTDWMRNENQPAFFEQYISVGSTLSNDRVTEAVKQGKQPSLQFFPEGGNLVNDISSKVAFKALGPDGLGINFTAVVVDNQNNQVGKITPSHLGMGVFDLLPEAGKLYKAKVTFADGTQNTFDLPAADQKGITLAVNTSNPAKVSIEIKANRPYYKENLNKELSLIIYWGGAVRTVKTKLDNSILGLDLPANTFRTGILQVTLLVATGEPLNERLSFIQNNDLLNLNIGAGKQQFAKHENVPLTLNIKNQDGNPVNGSFSVSVIDESKILVDENAESSILSNLLLTSDLKGYVEKPNYYFANKNAETQKNLDVLMLTQGYRRFVWKNLLSENALSEYTFKPEKGLDISGVLSSKAGAPIPNSKITLIAESGGSVLTQQTDEKGKFRFANTIFETGTKFILKTESSLRKNIVITFDKANSGPAVAEENNIDARYNANADLLATLQNNKQPGLMTAANSVVAQATLPSNEGYSNSALQKSYRSSNLGGPGHADQVILGDQIKNSPTLSSGLNGLARGVQFSSGIPYLPSSMIVTGGNQGVEPMLVMVDGIGVGAGANIDLYNPVDIEAVEILKGPNATIYGTQGGSGVIVITTKQGSEKASIVSKEMSPGIFSVTPQGFYKARDFYVPDNNTANTAAINQPTIFWKPNVNTDANGNVLLNFNNNDSSGNVRVVVEGMDTKGNLGRQVFRYKVQ